MTLTADELIFIKELLHHEIYYESYGESFSNQLQNVYNKIDAMLDDCPKEENK